MAPEQLAARRVTAAADMWSWAVSMTFAGTGQLPFTGESLTAIAYAILHGEPVIGSLSEPLGSLVRPLPQQEPGSSALSSRCATRACRRRGAAHGPAPATSCRPLTRTTRHPSPADNTSRSARVPQRVAGACPRHGRALEKPDQAGAVALGLARGGARDALQPRSSRQFCSLGVPEVWHSSCRTMTHRQRVPAGDRAGGSQELTAGNAAGTQAVTWILQQVSRAAIVSCDSQVCADLAGRGFPDLDPLGPESNDPLDSNVVVATADIRNQFGGRLASVYAPVILASFGQVTP